MKTPGFWGTLHPIAAPTLPPLLGVGPIGGNSAQVALPFAMQLQEMSNWCWAAVTSSVSQYFDSNSQWTQCAVASKCLTEPCCSSDGPCNQPWTLDHPLSVTSNLKGSVFVGAASMVVIASEISKGRPVCCHIDWGNGMGHFVAVTGYSSGVNDVEVQDPLVGSALLPYATFVSNYQEIGTWGFSYFTEP